MINEPVIPIEVLEQQANNGSLTAKHKLGLIYHLGRYYNRQHIKQNKELGLALINEAANAGNEESKSYLASLIEQDSKAAIARYREEILKNTNSGSKLNFFQAVSKWISEVVEELFMMAIGLFILLGIIGILIFGIRQIF